MYVCMCVYVCVCTQSTCAFNHLIPSLLMLAFPFSFHVYLIRLILMNMIICLHTHMYLYIYIYIHMYTHMYICMYMHKCNICTFTVIMRLAGFVLEVTDLWVYMFTLDLCMYPSRHVYATSGLRSALRT